MSATKTKSSKAVTLARLQALIGGLQKRFPNGQFTLGKVAYTTATLVQLFESLIAAINAVNAAQASAKDAVMAMRGSEAKVNPVLRDLERFILSMFGTTATQDLADFGMEPPKAPAPRTSEEKAAAAAKLRATRAARGTASKKSKRAVKGNVTGVEITPVTAPAPATPSAQPAPAASGAPNPGTPSK